MKKNKIMAKTEKETREHAVRNGTKTRIKALNRISSSSFLKRYSGIIHFIYGGKCAICGWRASEKHEQKSGSYGNELHHIISVKNNGPDNFSNLIPLCPNHHKQADLGILSIEEIRKFQIKNEDAESICELREHEMYNKMNEFIDGKTQCNNCIIIPFVRKIH